MSGGKRQKSSRSTSRLASPQSSIIVHISDLHIGSVDRPDVMAAALIADLKSLHIENVDFLVISGDAVNKGWRRGYLVAAKFIKVLQKRYRLGADGVLLVPGNHDIDYERSGKSYVYKSKYSGASMPPRGVPCGDHGWLQIDPASYKDRFPGFSSLFKAVYGSSYTRDPGEQYTMIARRDLGIVFLGLNTCVHIDHINEIAPSIDESALFNGIEQAARHSSDDWLRIAVWHHPVRGERAIKNDDFVEHLVGAGFHIGMHGDIHKPEKYMRELDSVRGLRIVGAGTFASDDKQLPPGLPRQYNILEVDMKTREVLVRSRRREGSGQVWRADARFGTVNQPEDSYSFIY
jgi:predicted MPP superfamily phosphohydrolase